jgi:hypothetical protein
MAGMFMGSIKSIAGDCKKTHRWALANLTGDDANSSKREKLSQRRIIGIGKSKVRLMSNSGEVIEVEPVLIQRVW